MFSQSQLANEPRGFGFAPRTCATTLVFSGAAGFFFGRFGTERGRVTSLESSARLSPIDKRKAGHVGDMSRFFERPRRLLEVLVDELRHLEHRDATLAAEYRLELVVSDDHAALLRILKVVPLDVAPELLGDFRARHAVVANDCAERRGRLHRLHERRVRRALLLRAALLRGLLGATLLRAALLHRLLRAALLGAL